MLDALARLDVETPNRSGLPIIEIPLRQHEDIDEVGRFLFERGVYVTLAAYPLVPKDEVGFRVQLTAANTVEEVDRVIAAVEALVERGMLRSARAAAEREERDGMTSPRAAPRQRVGRLPRGGRAAVRPVSLGPAAEGQRAADEPDRPVAGDRDPRGHHVAPARRRDCPWYLLAAGSALFWLGDLYTYSYPHLLGAEVPFPSLGDAFYVAMYPVMMAGLLLLVRRRNVGRIAAGMVDGLILTVGLSLPAWIALMAPYLHLDDLSALGKVVSVAYPVGDVILIGAIVRLALDAGRRSRRSTCSRRARRCSSSRTSHTGC